MRIEKVNDTQIRVTLSHADLTPRDIKISELAYGSQKAQELFREMMTQAHEQFGFETENIPLMIEAVPLSRESIMIVVTKIEDPSQIDARMGALGERPNHRTFKAQNDKVTIPIDKPAKTKKEAKQAENPVLIYSFPSLDRLTDVGHKINAIYCGMNSLYKKDQDHYFIVLHPNFMHKTTHQQLESVLDEFGSKHVSSSLGEAYLKEHSTLLIKDKALEVLTKYL